MKIAFFEIEGWEEKYLKKALKGHSLKFFSDPLSRDNAAKISDFDIISVFIYSQVNGAVLAELNALKLIATRSTGFDHIDLAECRRRKISVANVPFYGENTVAEHTFALILALSRNIHKAYNKTVRRDFSMDGLIGFDLKGKTLGVIGAGYIGLNVIKIAKGFDMKVLAFDTHRNRMIADVLGFEYASLDTLLEKSDIVSINVPHNKHTHHLINQETIRKMKPGATLINTSRGGIVATDALLDALDSGHLRGAGLDVLEGEDLIREEKQLLHEHHRYESLANVVKNHILLNRDNVVFTPHIGFYSIEALQRILETTVMNMTSFLGGMSQNIVNLDDEK